MSSYEVKKIIKSLKRKKNASSFCISVSILIDLVDVYLLLTDITDSFKKGIFLDETKLVEVIPLLKKADPFDKTNYQLVSLVSHISKVLERVYNQINEYIKSLQCKALTGFRKSHNTEHSLLKMLEILRKF